MAPQPDERPTREPIDTLLRDLKTGRDGLGSREAARRLAIHGPNTLPTGRRASWLRELVRQFTHPLALLLWVAAGLAWVAGTPVLCWAILAVIVINAVVAYLQGRQAERAIEALSRYLPQQATVIRDGVASEVPAVDLVPGDVILVTEGDRVSADARLIEGSVEMDLSTLTGESAPVVRSAGAEDTADRLIDAPDAVFSGAQCTSGQARAVAFATGAATELGRIATLSRQATPLLSPLERQVRRSTWLIAGVAVGVGALFLPLGLLAGLSLPEAAVFAIGLLVANVPEGLLPTITLALAVGVRVLARQGALVKQLSAVETLGSTTVICTDKTGTLTRNTMTVTAVWSAGRTVDPVSPDAALGPLAQVMVDCNQLERLSDPMEVALREAGELLGARVAPRVETFPFDAERKRMSVVSRRGDRLLVAVKGAPELLLPLCDSVFDGTRARPATESDRREVLDEVDGFARHGLRVLALASREVPAPPEDAAAAESGLCLLGLVALLDPPRPEVPAAVAACHSAGITIHVVTGDNGTTASEVARQVGIATDRVVTGSEADALSEPELDALLAQPGEVVFARSTPEGKLRIAEALQQEGQTVAMTGDGVNDAPALHRADIGVAMGRSGTDVARQAATMVLTDDNFATIVTAIREGRRAYDNLRKFVLYIFVHAVPEVVPFMLFALSGGAIPLPLTVLQILAIDLGTEILPALALGREKAEPDVMSRRPRPRSEPLITRRLLVRAWGLMGVLSAALALGAFFAVLVAGGWTPGAPVGPGDPLHGVYLQATTATFLTIVACQVGTAFAARTERTSLRRLGVLSNPPLLAAIGVELLFAAALCFVPVLQTVFGTAPPPWWLILFLLPCPVIVWGADEAARWFGRRSARAPSRPRRPSSG
ncbi:cation-translocating P-type ATPase [Leifsonia virtsii]|uniref:Cation-transporting P-type ATPase n=1 Tax=Leifsonia virtsii TaxID=3035915 RepID=A0ABT8IUT5_9MICO|nr:cation-transporting P-type ATPase [Leifsonia virtsii]MDN4596555.1 cation-transporting P-type ATPase [Leifsonia virtsii]